MPLDSETERGYWTARNGIAIMDLSMMGRLRITGADGLDLLHRLSTQDIKGLKPGEGAITILTNEKGRIMDMLVIYVMDDHLFVHTSTGTQASTMAWIEKYTIAEDVTTTDVSADTSVITFFGKNARQLAEMLGGKEGANLPAFHHRQIDIGGMKAMLSHSSTFGGGDNYLLAIQGRKEMPDLLDALLSKGAALGIDLIGPRSFNILRIEAGGPLFGREYDDRFNPLEIGQEKNISFTKGCYIGQEVIARLDSYHKVQKHLMGLYLPEGDFPRHDDKLTLEGREAGYVTSSTYSPALKRNIALAFVRSAHAEPGTKLIVHTAQGEKQVEVAALPFLL